MEVAKSGADAWVEPWVSWDTRSCQRHRDSNGPMLDATSILASLTNLL